MIMSRVMYVWILLVTIFVILNDYRHGNVHYCAFMLHSCNLFMRCTIDALSVASTVSPHVQPVPEILSLFVTLNYMLVIRMEAYLP